MMFRNRSYQVWPLADLDEVVTKLTEHDWTTCQAFAVENLLLANDSTGPDGAQEYAVIRDGRQIESLTVSWMKPERLKEVLQELLDGGSSDMGAVTLNTDHPSGSCEACA